MSEQIIVINCVLDTVMINEEAIAAELEVKDPTEEEFVDLITKAKNKSGTQLLLFTEEQLNDTKLNDASN